MVSLRTNKNTKSLVGEKRRSARLVELEQHAVHPWQKLGTGISSDQMRRKGKNVIEENEGSYYARETGESSNSKSVSNRTTDQIIEHVLDVLELKDTHELFTMPDSMQIDDYTERVKNPSDFATLRQKHIDGMYKTLEQFESDVYMVFKKAMTINDKNTIPYKQAVCLQDQAKQVFQSIKNNRTYSELELSAWHKKYVRGRKRARRNDETAPASSSNQAGPTQSDAHSEIESGITKASLAVNNGNRSSNITKKYARNVRSGSSQIVRTKIDKFEISKPHMEEPRSTYMVENDSGSGISTSNFGNPRPGLVFNPFSPRYLESLRLFAKSAGKEAQRAAELLRKEVTEKAKISNFTRGPFVSPQLGTGPNNSASNTTRPTSIFAPNVAIYNTPYCKLETDDLLKWFSLIGTPEFLEHGKAGKNSNSHMVSDVPRLQSNDKQPTNQVRIAQFQDMGSTSKPNVKESKSVTNNAGISGQNSSASTCVEGPELSQFGFGRYAGRTSKPFKF